MMQEEDKASPAGLSIGNLPNELLHMILLWIEDVAQLCRLRLVDSRFQALVDAVPRWGVIEYDGNKQRKKGGKELDIGSLVKMLETTHLNLKHLSLTECNNITVKDLSSILNLRGKSLESLVIESCCMIQQKGFPNLETIIRKCPILKKIVIMGDPVFSTELSPTTLMQAVEGHQALPFTLIKSNMVGPCFSLVKPLCRYCKQFEFGQEIKMPRVQGPRFITQLVPNEFLCGPDPFLVLDNELCVFTTYTVFGGSGYECLTGGRVLLDGSKRETYEGEWNYGPRAGILPFVSVRVDQCELLDLIDRDKAVSIIVPPHYDMEDVTLPLTGKGQEKNDYIGDVPVKLKKMFKGGNESVIVARAVFESCGIEVSTILDCWPKSQSLDQSA